MTDAIDDRPAESSAETGLGTESRPETDLGAEIRRVLAESHEPLTLSKIRAGLPSAYRGLSLDDLGESLRRQVAANLVIPYPKYRSQQDRFWDRPMPVHVAGLLREALTEGPLPWSELRRKLPAYAVTHAEVVLQEELAQNRLHRHPRTGGRGKERFGAAPPDPKDYLRQELRALFDRLGQLGFTHAQLRAGALELLHEEEWASPRETGPGQGRPEETSPGPPAASQQPSTGPGAEPGPGTYPS
jgi:hypothetical protein